MDIHCIATSTGTTAAKKIEFAYMHPLTISDIIKLNSMTLMPTMQATQTLAIIALGGCVLVNYFAGFFTFLIFAVIFVFGFFSCKYYLSRDPAKEFMQDFETIHFGFVGLVVQARLGYHSIDSLVKQYLGRRPVSRARVVSPSEHARETTEEVIDG